MMLALQQARVLVLKGQYEMVKNHALTGKQRDWVLKTLTFLLCDTRHVRQLIHQFPTNFCLFYIYAIILQAGNFQADKEGQGRWPYRLE